MDLIFGVSVGLNILFNFLLIPPYGALGAAYTSFFTQGFALGSQVIIAKKAFNLKTDWLLIGRLVTLAVILFGGGYVMVSYFTFLWIGQFFTIISLGLGVGFALRLLKLEAFLQLFQNK